MDQRGGKPGGNGRRGPRPPDPPTLVSGGPSSREWPRASPSLRAAVAAFENGHDRPLRTAAPCSGPESCPTLCGPTARQAPPPCAGSATQRQPPRAWLRGDMLELILWPSRPGWRAGCCGMLPAIYHPAAPLSPQMGKLRPQGPPATFRQVASEPPAQTEVAAEVSPQAGLQQVTDWTEGKMVTAPLGSPGPRGTPQEE